jgi:hypothetical protein
MGVTHHLDGTLQENLHGWFDAGLEPRVTVEPGDRVVYRTADAMWDRDAPDAGTDRPRLARPEGAGHALAGPVRIPCRSSSVCELVAASTPMRPGRRLEPADHAATGVRSTERIRTPGCSLLPSAPRRMPATGRYACAPDQGCIRRPGRTPGAAAAYGLCRPCVEADVHRMWYSNHNSKDTTRCLS